MHLTQPSDHSMQQLLLSFGLNASGMCRAFLVAMLNAVGSDSHLYQPQDLSLLREQEGWHKGHLHLIALNHRAVILICCNLLKLLNVNWLFRFISPVFVGVGETL